MADNAKANLYMKLVAVQSAASVGKNRYNDFGNFYYRTIGDLFAAIKPALAENKAVIYIEDEIVLIGNETVCDKNGAVMRSGEKSYVKATVHFVDCETGEEVTTTAYARECAHKNMSEDQSSGSASSYARKYALNAMLLVDEGTDADSANEPKKNNNQQPQGGKKDIAWGGKKNSGNQSSSAVPPIPDDVPPPEVPPQYQNPRPQRQQGQRSAWGGNKANPANEPSDMPPLPEPPFQYTRNNKPA